MTPHGRWSTQFTELSLVDDDRRALALSDGITGSKTLSTSRPGFLGFHVDPFINPSARVASNGQSCTGPTSGRIPTTLKNSS
jgi:hypothetical protein